MSHTFDDAQIEECWKHLLRKKRTARADRFDYVFAQASKLDTNWKLDKVCVSCLSTKPYTCICSQSIDRFYLVSNKKGNTLRIGKECIHKVLTGADLERAKRAMDKAEVEEKEFRKMHEQERVFINNRLMLDI